MADCESGKKRCLKESVVPHIIYKVGLSVFAESTIKDFKVVTAARK